MTIGANDLFVRPIVPTARSLNRTQFEFFPDPITLENEAQRARLGFLSPKMRAEIIRMRECRGETRRNVRCNLPRSEPLEITLPHPGLSPLQQSGQCTFVYSPPPAHADLLER